MGLIVKPNSFTGQAAPQLPWLDADIDTIFSEFNGNIDNDNIKTAAAIAQAKIANLVTDMAARMLKAGDTMSGVLVIRMSIPTIFLKDLAGLATGVGDWAIHTSTIAGRLIFFENAGTDAAPNYVERFALDPGGVPLVGTDLTTKTYVDALVATVGPLAFGKTHKQDANFTTASLTFEDVTGLSVTITTGARRCRVTLTAKSAASAGSTRILSVNLQIDGVDVAGSNGLIAVASTGSTEFGNASFSFVSNVLTAAQHVFKIQVKTNVASSVLWADATSHAILSVEELPLVA